MNLIINKRKVMCLKMNCLMVAIALVFCLHSVSNAQETGQIKEGINLIQNKEYEKAKIIFKEIVEDHPKNILANFNLGKIYYEEGDFGKAVTFFDKAVNLNNQNANYYVWLGKAYEGKLEDASLFSFSSITAKMKSNFKKAIEINPDNIDARYELAKLFNNASPLVGGSDSEARKQLKEIQKRDPLKGYELSAYFHWYKEEWEPAIQDYQKYIERDTNNAEVYYSLGICFLQIKNYNKAFENFKASVKINPDKDKAHYYLGKLHLKRGEKELARKEFEKAIKINPEKELYKNALNNL